MHTYEMVGLADENGRTYESPWGTYNKQDGFVINDNGLDTFFPGGEDTEVSVREFFDALVHDNVWKLKKEPERKKMSIEDIERELGYKVQIVDPEYGKPEGEKKNLNDDDRKAIDDVVKFWRDLFGVDLDSKKYK